MTRRSFDRRRFMIAGATGIASLLAGCDRLAESSSGRRILGLAEDLTYMTQRALLDRRHLAPEFTETDITTNFKSNGTGDPRDREYRKIAGNGFVDWRLRVVGLVENALEFSLSDLRALPARTQITRHDCVEGWSCIGKWTGTPLSEVLARAKVKDQARFVVFHCADTMEGGDDELEQAASMGQPDNVKGTPKVRTLDSQAIRYYESLDLVDAAHPQTILAYEMNGKPLPIPHGAPLRLRVERQLGYKMAKYLMRVELVDSLAAIGEGRGGYWEDRGYEWYAGI